ncbi:Sodium/calcium exchanger protein domain-containing protein [Venturia nashicola]|nr:Sodium/calcium exchanger protein domain-containing protein [Venturia nashicola]
MRGLFAPPPAVNRRKRAQRSGAISFCLVLLTLSIFALYKVLGSSCRLVHGVADKCAFIKKNCPDEQAGLFPYLEFYYCNTPAAKPFAFATIVLWMCVLFSTIGIAASDFFCINLSTIATLLGLSESLAGVTFLAFGNGSPDVFSTFSAMSTNSGSLAIGELIGAASFITAVVAGAMAFVRPFKVAKKSFVRDVVFFIIAASLSMVFLHDGKLYLWEAVAMVGIYVFYVIFVVLWHWWFTRRRKRREREAAARTQFVAPGSMDLAFPEYHDEDETAAPARPNPSRAISAEDFSALERGRLQTGDGKNEFDDREEEELEDRRKRWLGEINSDMRLSKRRDRRPTHNPVRPSLIGALEFNSIISGLHRSGNMKSIPLNLRRYSDDGRLVDGSLNADAHSAISEPHSRAPYEVEREDESGLPLPRPFLDVGSGLGGRSRAVSAPDADALRLNTANIPTIDLLGPLAEDDGSSIESRTTSAENGVLPPPHSPTISISPPGSHQGSRAASPAAPVARARSPFDLLTIPGAIFQAKTVDTPSNKPIQPPKLTIPQGEYLPAYRDRISPVSPNKSPNMSGGIPPASASPLSEFPFDLAFDITGGNPIKWWPYKILPSPFELWATLFPTLCGWKTKNWWERLLGMIAAPSVFLLTITLPVVETETEEQEPDDDIPDLTLPGGTSYFSDEASRRGRSHTNLSIIVDPAEPSQEEVNGHHDTSLGANQALQKGLGGHGTTATIAASTEHHHQLHDHAQAPMHPHHRSYSQTILSPSDRTMMGSPEQLPLVPEPKLPSPKDWCRWLVILQAYIAPFFIVLIFWAKFEMDKPKALIKPTLIALACSTAATVFVLLTTTASHAPKWRVVMCFLGFIVSITWISTIADEVVGVLKTIGVILNISDAILGLTIFAVGNSLGDLVADYTVAKLGYPVMALSACFGGPMLNILLGVGLSGVYLTIKGAKHRQAKHPGKELRFKPYTIDVSRTLMISGVTLLVTLTGLLIVVPLRRWKMDRFIGWCLIALWSVSTVCNVLVEVLGVGMDGVFGWT